MAQECCPATPWRSKHGSGIDTKADWRAANTEQAKKPSRFFAAATAHPAQNTPPHDLALASDAQHNKARASTHDQQGSNSLTATFSNPVKMQREHTAAGQTAGLPGHEQGLDLIDELLDLPAEGRDHSSSAPNQAGPAASQQPARGGFAAAKKLNGVASLRGGFAGAKRQGAANLLQQALLKKGTEAGKPRPGNLARQHGFNPPRQLAAPKAQPLTAAADHLHPAASRPTPDALQPDAHREHTHSCDAPEAAEKPHAVADRHQQSTEAARAQPDAQHAAPHIAQQAQHDAAHAQIKQRTISMLHSQPECTEAGTHEPHQQHTSQFLHHTYPQPPHQQLQPDLPAQQQQHQPQQELPQKHTLPHHLQHASATPPTPPFTAPHTLSNPPAHQHLTPQPTHPQAHLSAPQTQAGSAAPASPQAISFGPVRRSLGKIGTHHKKSRLNASSQPAAHASASSPDSARRTPTDTSQESPAAAAAAPGQQKRQLPFPLSQPPVPHEQATHHTQQHQQQQQQQHQQQHDQPAQEDPLDMLRKRVRQGAQPNLAHKPVQQQFGRHPPAAAQGSMQQQQQQPASRGNPFARRTTPAEAHIPDGIQHADQVDEHELRHKLDQSPWAQPAAHLHTPAPPSTAPLQHQQRDIQQTPGANGWYATPAATISAPEAGPLPADLTPAAGTTAQRTDSTEQQLGSTERPGGTEQQPGGTEQQPGRKRRPSSRRRDRPRREMKRLYTDSQGSQDEQAEEMRVYGIRMPDQAQEREDQDLLMDLSFLKTPVPFPSAAPASISSAQLMPAHARPSMSPEPAARAASTAAAPSSAGLHHVPRRKFTPSAEPESADGHRRSTSADAREASPQLPAANPAKPDAAAQPRASSFSPAPRPSANAGVGQPKLLAKPQAAASAQQQLRQGALHSQPPLAAGAKLQPAGVARLQQPATAAVKPQLKRLKKAGAIAQETQQGFDQQQNKPSLLLNPRQPPLASFTTAAAASSHHIPDSPSSSSSEDDLDPRAAEQQQHELSSKDDSAENDEDDHDSADHDIIDLAGNSSGDDDSPSEHDDSDEGQPEVIEDPEDEVQLISCMPAQQQRQQQRGRNGGRSLELASNPSEGGRHPTGASAGEPWWKRFPDFVPVEALKWGKNPRDDTPVYINYWEQFSSSSRVTLEAGSSRRSSKCASARKTGEAGAKKSKKRTWFSRKAYHRR